MNTIEQAQLLGILMAIGSLYQDTVTMDRNDKYNQSLERIHEALMKGKKMGEEEAWDLLTELPTPAQHFADFMESYKEKVAENIEKSIKKS